TNKSKRFNSKIISLFVPSIYNNLKDIVTYIKENDIKIPLLKFLNIISTTPNEDYVTFFRSRKTLEYDGNLEELKNILNILKEIDVIPEKIIVRVENKDYNYEVFKGIKSDIKLNYGDMEDATIEEFITMRETINYYKSLIKQANLTPIEEITYAYDLIKSFEYKEGEDLSDSRCLHKCIKGGKIVCVGYSIFLKQVLSELGYRIDTLNANVVEENGKYSDMNANHVKNIIRIDDNTYNIHMVAALDTTWDANIREEDVTRKRAGWESTIPSVDSILSYIYFLIPKNEYQFVFNDKEMPSIFYYPPEAFAKNYEYLPRIERPVQSVDQGRYHIQKLFDKDEVNLIAPYINAKRPPYEQFKEIIRRVKQAEGFTYEEANNLSNSIYLDRSDLDYIDIEDRIQKKKR
ncbi:MAG: arylamine N-acetyltransferase, partial [Bacilli bacterium]|nr:arylamine N-acetyltransferase [Bacilli bacterium]